MIFSSFRFLVFLPLVLLLYFAVPRLRWRQWMLLVASYVFYGSWDPRFCLLILASTLVDYGIGLGLGATDSPRARRMLLGCSLVANLGALGLFKYFNFFLESARIGLQALGSAFDPAAAVSAATGIAQAPGTGLLEIVLPVGISFYTFQTMSYTLDVYRRELEPTRDFVRFALFVSFFPQLVAGPIVRAVELLPQLGLKLSVRSGDVAEGLYRFAVGFAKKVLIADNIAPFVDRVFGDAQAWGPGTLWLGSIGFAAQCYCDFSGYSDMAIGTSRLLGFRLPENFKYPFTALNVAQFWRRWHITLYAFMRDYLYLPLGGSRVSPGRRLFNALFTMTVVGFWHGAAWRFVLWGFYNGALVVLSGLLTGVIVTRPRLEAALDSLPGLVFRVLMVNVAFAFSFCIFRSADLGAVVHTVGRMLGFGSGGDTLFEPGVLVAYLAVVAGCLAAERGWPERLRARTGPVAQGLVWAAVIVALVLFAPDGSEAFVYFQF